VVFQTYGIVLAAAIADVKVTSFMPAGRWF